MLEHWITHLPFRNWCQHCVAGKCKSKPHMTAGKIDDENGTPIVAFDYAFMSDKEATVQPKDIGKDRDEVEKDEEKDSDVKMLVCRDNKSKVPAAISVPSKGVDENEYAVRRVLRFLDFLGYEKVILKSDQESAMKAVLSSVRAHRGIDTVWENTQTMMEHSPVGDSQSNGLVERTIQSVESQVRTMKSALESNLGKTVPADWPILNWRVEHAGNLLAI